MGVWSSLLFFISSRLISLIVADEEFGAGGGAAAGAGVHDVFSRSRPLSKRPKASSYDKLAKSA